MVNERYEFIRHINTGGQGSVSLYSDKYLDREVAVKTILSNQNSNIIEEVDLLESVCSKHVVNLYDVIQTNSQVDIYLEYLGGDDLRDKAGNCTFDEFLSLAYQLASGLADIHASGICHRDIKLENAKFDTQGVLKIFDFGVSRIGNQHNTMNGFGTVQYLAPECYELITNDSVELTFAVDIYALGVTLHKLIFNDFCDFHGKLGYPETKIKFNTLNFSQELSDLLNSTLELKPEDRPTALQLKLNLERELLKSKHIGLFASSNKMHLLDKNTLCTQIKFRDDLFITIKYDLSDFIIVNVMGSIYINNKPAIIGNILPEACVLTFKLTQSERFFVSFSSSHPELVL
ncbi:serine/threonine-protein kinase [Photobacterium piscicola]|uniref:serine/threonine-protein kinase n=1 Tax=Photobacterium piscicola TaxID=1378299 RepID=UPI002E17DE0D|nr:serine/threonine-protein kinase [Photobacterium piscicola]